MLMVQSLMRDRSAVKMMALTVRFSGAFLGMSECLQFEVFRNEAKQNKYI